MNSRDFHLVFSIHRHSAAVIDLFQCQDRIVSIDKNRNISITNLLNHYTCAMISCPTNDNFVSIASDKSNAEILYFTTESHSVYEYQVPNFEAKELELFTAKDLRTSRIQWH